MQGGSDGGETQGRQQPCEGEESLAAPPVAEAKPADAVVDVAVENKQVWKMIILLMLV